MPGMQGSSPAMIMWWWAGQGFSGPGWTGKLRDRLTVLPLSTSAAAAFASAGPRWLSVPRSSSAPQRFQFDTASNSSCTWSAVMVLEITPLSSILLEQGFVGARMAHAGLQLDQFDQVAVGIVAADRADDAQRLLGDEHVPGEAHAPGLQVGIGAVHVPRAEGDDAGDLVARRRRIG